MKEKLRTAIDVLIANIFILWFSVNYIENPNYFCIFLLTIHTIGYTILLDQNKKTKGRD